MATNPDLPEAASPGPRRPGGPGRGAGGGQVRHRHGRVCGNAGRGAEVRGPRCCPPRPPVPCDRPGWPPRTAPARCAARTWRQRIPRRLGLPGVQADLILGAVQPEADSALSLAAIKVLDEQGRYLPGHRFAISSLPRHQPRPAETYKSATTWMICERSLACPEAIAPHWRLCADQVTTAGGPRRVPFAVHQMRTGKGGRRTAGYSRGDAIVEPALRSSARGSPAVSACLAVISSYDTGCPPSIT